MSTKSCIDCREKDSEIRDLKEKVATLSKYASKLEMEKAKLIHQEESLVNIAILFLPSAKTVGFFFFWLNYSILDFRATGAPLDWKTWIHLNQNIWMIRMMMIGCQSQKKKKNLLRKGFVEQVQHPIHQIHQFAALAVKTLLAKQSDAHAMLLDVVVGLRVLVSVPTAELSRVVHQSSKFMSPFHEQTYREFFVQDHSIHILE